MDEIRGSQGTVQTQICSLKESMETIKRQLELLIKRGEDASRANPLIRKFKKAELQPTGRKSAEEGQTTEILAIKDRKFEIPTFDGKDADGWIIQAERYFSLNRMSNKEQIELSGTSFKGDALRWFRWEHNRHPFTCWEELRPVLLKQFGSTSKGIFWQQFWALKQEGLQTKHTIHTVQGCAPTACAPTIAPPEVVKVNTTLLGGQSFLSHGLDLGKFGERGLALKIGEDNMVCTRDKTAGKHSDEVRRLFDSEVQQEKAQGLCYQSDEKCTRGYKCEKKKVNIMEVQKAEKEGEVEGWNKGEYGLEVIMEPEVEVLLNSTVRLSTMKREDVTEGQKVMLVIDSGVTWGEKVVFLTESEVSYNFIPLMLVDKLGLVLKGGWLGDTHPVPPPPPLPPPPAAIVDRMLLNRCFYFFPP